MNALTGPLSGGAQGSEKIQQGEATKTRTGKSFDAVMEETAEPKSKSPVDAGQDSSETSENIDEKSEKIENSTPENTDQEQSDNSPHALQSKDAEAPAKLVAQTDGDAVEFAVDEDVDPTVSPADPKAESLSSDEGELVNAAVRNGVLGSEQRADDTRVHPQTTSEKTVGPEPKLAESLQVKSDTPTTATVDASTKPTQQPQTGTEPTATQSTDKLPGQVVETDRGTRGKPSEAALPDGAKSTAASAVGVSAPIGQSDTSAGRNTVVASGVQDTTAKSSLPLNAEQTSARADQQQSQTLASTAAQTNATMTAPQTTVAQSQANLAQAQAVAAQEPSVQAKERAESRQIAAEQSTATTNQVTALQTPSAVPQSAYSIAQFGLGAGTLSAANPTLSTLQVDAITATEHNAVLSGGSALGAEMPGLSQLLTEATLSPGTVHRPETPRLIANQMAEALVAKGDRNVDVALNPKELGHVNMRVSVTETGVSVMIQTERPETGDLMRRHISELADEFRRMGFEDISFEFSGGETSGGDAGDGSASAGTGQGRGGDLAASDDIDAETAALTPTLNTGETGLDMRL
ncbi:flagellar hook-length control protein FliK [Phaeobacter sp.]|uniref:flagellar hook-length control protein FliK n=1 Tax=Phaeobacter sp. TaxID=1902409 RepID=UPI0025D00F6E|nr:flagellar hook-length control protein FliK [Phaeobacter sp.]